MKEFRIDFHTHWDAKSYGSSDSDPSRFLEMLDIHGLDRAVILPTRSLMDAGQIFSDNREVALAGQRSKGRLIPLGTVNLWNEPEALRETRLCFEELAMAGLKFHPWLQGASVNLLTMDKVCDILEEFGGIAYFHDGTPPFSLPAQIGLLAARHPNVRFVLGHCGLLEYWRESLMVLQNCPNVWGCICGPSHAAARTILQEGPHDRLMWGSDFGFGLMDHIAFRLKELKAWELSPEDEERLIVKNPSRLLREIYAGSDRTLSPSETAYARP